MPLSKDRVISQVSLGTIGIPKYRKTEPHLYGRDLGFAGSDTQYSTHALHAYPAAMNPVLAKELIITYVPKSQTVLDPFCGGGAVLVESVLAGRQCTGLEVNPLAVKISSAKTTHISKERLTEAYHFVKEKVHEYRNLVYPCDKWTLFWFKPYVVPALSSIQAVIPTIEDESVRNLFEVIFSATVRDVMLTYRGEVRLRRLVGRDYKRFNPDVLQAFDRRAKLAIERVSSLPVGARADVKLQDVRRLAVDDETFTSIVCSPPYGDDKNGVGYFQFSKNMLAWLGMQPTQIKDYKSMFLGADKVGKIPPPSMILAMSLETMKSRRAEHLEEAVSFYSDYYDALKQMVRVTKETVIIVIGNRVLGRTVFDNAMITLDLMRSIGVRLKHHYQRTLRKKRIANLGGDGGGTTTEHILVFHK